MCWLHRDAPGLTESERYHQDFLSCPQPYSKPATSSTSYSNRRVEDAELPGWRPGGALVPYLRPRVASEGVIQVPSTWP